MKLIRALINVVYTLENSIHVLNEHFGGTMIVILYHNISADSRPSCQTTRTTNLKGRCNINVYRNFTLNVILILTRMIILQKFPGNMLCA